MVKYIHQEDYKNIAGNGEHRENIDILLYHWRRSQARRAKCIALRPKYSPLHTLGIYLRFWKVFCKIISAGKRNFCPRELDKAVSIYDKMAIVYQVQKVLINYCNSSILGHSVSGSGISREMLNIRQNKEVLKQNFQIVWRYWLSTQPLLKMG
jgi:hypothetical protein